MSPATRPRILLATLFILTKILLLQSQSPTHADINLVGTNLQVHQSFGVCSEVQVETLFKSYPQECNDAYSNLTFLLQQGTQVGEKEMEETYKTICTDVCLKPVLLFGDSCEANHLIPPISQLCEVNQQKSEFCIAALYKNNGTGASKECHGAVSTGRCSQGCKIALRSMVDDLGCCINSLFNVTTYGFDALKVASYELWSICDLASPGYCHGYRDSSSGDTLVPSTVVTVIAVLTVTAMVMSYL